MSPILFPFPGKACRHTTTPARGRTTGFWSETPALVLSIRAPGPIEELPLSLLKGTYWRGAGLAGTARV